MLIAVCISLPRLIVYCVASAWILAHSISVASEDQNRADLIPDELASRIVAFCGSCHRYPAPDILPRRIWDKEIRRMYELAKQLAPELPSPNLDDTLRYYLGNAPESFDLSVDKPPNPAASPDRFQRWTLPLRTDPPTPRASA